MVVAESRATRTATCWARRNRGGTGSPRPQGLRPFRGLGAHPATAMGTGDGDGTAGAQLGRGCADALMRGSGGRLQGSARGQERRASRQTGGDSLGARSGYMTRQKRGWAGRFGGAGLRRDKLRVRGDGTTGAGWQAGRLAKPRRLHGCDGAPPPARLPACQPASCRALPAPAPEAAGTPALLRSALLSRIVARRPAHHGTSTASDAHEVAGSSSTAPSCASNRPGAIGAAPSWPAMCATAS